MSCTLYLTLESVIDEAELDMSGSALTGTREKAQRFWKEYQKNKPAVAGLAVIAFFVVIAFSANLIAPSDPFDISGENLAQPSAKHPLGTDDLGRDIYTGVVKGSRVSLTVGFLSALISTFIGILIGGFAGYFGGRSENVLMRISDFFLIIPRFFLAMLVIVLFGASLLNIIVVIGITSWPGTARLARAEFLSLRELEYVESARVLGASNMRIIFSEILPNAAPPIIVNSAISMSTAVLIEAGLSFLGLGDPSLVSWGSLLRNAQSFLRVAWWLAFFPGLCILLTAWGLNLIGDGLNDALNPRLRRKVEASW